MPVLTTTGKNLFDINGEFITTGATNSINGNSLTVTGEWFTRQVVDLKPNTTYTFSYEKAESDSGYVKTSIYTNGTSAEVGQSNTNKLTFTTPQSFTDISVIFYAEEGGNVNTVTYTSIQLEKGSVATSYEPHKLNILSVNEEVELRAIGDVKDELNLLTGELTQRIGEYIYVGEENDVGYNASVGGYLTAVNVGGYIGLEMANGAGVVSDKLLNQSFVASDVGVYGNLDGRLFIYDKTVNSAEEFITKHKGTTFAFVLKEPSVKTVDLNIVDQDGKETDNIHTFDNLTYINTDSNGLIPIININKEVSYESILKPSTTYTFNFNQVNIGNEDLVINVGGAEVVYDGSENMTITTPSELSNNTISFYGKNHIVNNLVMVEGEEKINIYGYFTGMTNYKKESDKKSILIINNCPFVFGKGGRK
jgi:hypothetical protein